MFQNPGGGLAEIVHPDVWFDHRRLVAVGMHKDGGAACAPASPDVAPSISHKVTLGKSDVVLDGSGVQHARRGLAAGTPVGIVVIAHAHIVKGERLAQMCVKGFDLISRGEAPDDVRLVGHDDKKKTGAMQTVQGVWYTRKNLEIIQCKRRLRLPGSEDFPVDHPVAIQKNGGRQGAASDFVWAAFTFGWDTPAESYVRSTQRATRMISYNV